MVHIVGAGPGDSELITVKGAKYLKEADVVILAIDIQITGMERFEGKKVVKVGTSLVTKAPKQLIQKIESELKK